MPMRVISGRVLMVVAWAAWVACVAGCESTGGMIGGYSAQELYPRDVRTVAVPIFDNRTFYRGVEFDVTEALIKELELRTPYKVVRGEVADTALLGVVTDVRQRTLSRTFDGGIPQEQQVRVTVRFEWKDMRSGRVLRSRSAMTGTGEFVGTFPVSETFEVAQHTASAELARDIVSVMRRDW